MAVAGISNTYENLLMQKGNRSSVDKLTAVDSTGVNSGNSNVQFARLMNHLQGKDGTEYSPLASEDGTITYNGVMYICDDNNKCISLGDMSDSSNVLSIPLSGGGTLQVNRDNYGDLARSIGMFSPEDVNRIMRAIAEDVKCQQKQLEIEEKMSVGEEEDSI